MRVNITNMGARGYVSSGGRGWGFYSKLILDCKRSSASANKGRDIIDIDLYVEKNKLGKSFITIPVKCKQGVGIMWQQDKLEERSEEHTSELQSRGHLVCRLLLEKKEKRISKLI